MIGCSCEVCRSTDPHDKRTRSSILIEQGNTVVLVDTSTDFRFQALRAGIRHLDAILMTHAHADHLHGLDDTRSLTFDKTITVYGSKNTIDEIRKRFDYVFTPLKFGGGKPNLRLRDHHGSRLSVGELSIVPIPVKHGNLPIFGYRMGAFAYITDCSHVPESSLGLLDGVSHLVINALRYRPHPTHFNIDEAVETADRIGAKEVWLTHLCHEVSHNELTEELGSGNNGKRRILPAYDGLEIAVDS